MAVKRSGLCGPIALIDSLDWCLYLHCKHCRRYAGSILYATLALGTIGTHIAQNAKYQGPRALKKCKDAHLMLQQVSNGSSSDFAMTSYTDLSCQWLRSLAQGYWSACIFYCGNAYGAAIRLIDFDVYRLNLCNLSSLKERHVISLSWRKGLNWPGQTLAWKYRAKDESIVLIDCNGQSGFAWSRYERVSVV